MSDKSSKSYIKKQLAHYMRVLEKAEALEKEVMSACGFVLDKKYEYVYSDERSLYTTFCNATTQKERDDINHEIYNQTDEIRNMIKTFIKTVNGQLSEELIVMLTEAEKIRTKEYEELWVVGMLL